MQIQRENTNRFLHSFMRTHALHCDALQRIAMRVAPYVAIATVIVASGVGCALDDSAEFATTAGAPGTSGSASGSATGSTSGVSGSGGASGTGVYTDPIPEAICGDGTLHIYEQCDDGNTTNGDGCSGPGTGTGAARGCRLESGWKCDGQCDPIPNTTCKNTNIRCSRTTCGDGAIEGTETCDDRNVRPYDGCYECKKEPCVNGVCTNSCGDGILLPQSNSAEECDDGNLRDGDGCASTCLLEPGHTCHIIEDALPSVLKLPAIWRDFINSTNSGGGHPDFNPSPVADCRGMTAARLSSDGKPNSSNKVGVSGGCPSSASSFNNWYRKTGGSSGGSDNLEVLGTMDLTACGGNGKYCKNDNAYFPLDGRGWVGANKETALNNGHNFGFTSEVRYWFVYSGDEVLNFTGDDDLFVFVDGQLCVDIGGIHPAEGAVMNLQNGASALEQSCRNRLTVGNLYELAIFGAERHVSESNFSLTLEGFVTATSDCSPFCGDGQITAPEQCDDGVNNGTVYSSCGANCRPRAN